MSETTQKTNSSTFTQVGHTFYDKLNEFGAMKLGYSNNYSYIEIAPIFEDARGKEAKAGEKRYNWENPGRFYLTVDAIYQLKAALPMLLSGQLSIIRIPNGKNTAILEISKNAYDYGDVSDELTVSIVVQPNGKDDDSENRFYTYVFIASEVTLGQNLNGEDVTQVMCGELDYFTQWLLEETLRSSFNVEFHASRWANSFLKLGVGGSSSAAASANTVRSRPAMKRPGTGASTSTATSTSAAVDDVLGDD